MEIKIIFLLMTILYNVRNEFVGYYFDGITIALAKNIGKIEKCEDKQKIVDCINDIKFGEKLQSYKTGSVNSLNGRLVLFSEGVKETLDS